MRIRRVVIPILAPAVLGLLAGAPPGIASRAAQGVLAPNLRLPAAPPAPQVPVEVRSGVYRCCQGLTAPRTTVLALPELPGDELLPDRGTGVSLTVVIHADGSVGEVTVLRGRDPVRPALEAAAIEAVRRSRYAPARLGREPVAVELLTSVGFERPDRDLGLFSRRPLCDAAAYMETLRPDAEGAEPPVVTRAVRPARSAAARRLGLTGTAVVEVIVTEEGTVECARIRQSADSRYGLDDAALQAAFLTGFRPGHSRGRATRMLATVSFTFE